MHEPLQHDIDVHGGGFGTGFLCGATLGAVFGLMFAPRAGAELRRQIADSTVQFRRQAVDTYGQATKAVTDFASRGRAAVRRPAFGAGHRRDTEPPRESAATGTESSSR